MSTAIFSHSALFATQTERNNQAEEQLLCDIAVSVENFPAPSKFDELEAVITYTNRSPSQSIVLRLPTNERTYNFRDLDLSIDGEPATKIDPNAELADIIFQRVETLAPGESVRLIVPVFKIYELPQEWGQMEISAQREMEARGYSASVIIKNQDDE